MRACGHEVTLIYLDSCSIQWRTQLPRYRNLNVRENGDFLRTE